MANLPIDPTRWGITTALAEPRPDLDLDGNQKTTRAGVPRWRVPVGIVSPSGRLEAVWFVVSAAEKPQWVTPRSPVVIVDPVAIIWAMGDRSGIAYQAREIYDEGAGEFLGAKE